MNTELDEIMLAEMRKDKLERERVLTVKDWLKIFLIGVVPILGFIMLIKWLVSDKTNLNLKNYVKASLIIIAILFAIYIVLFGAIFGAMLSNSY